MKISLPHKFVFRGYQQKVAQNFDIYKRMLLIRGRRLGKDKTARQLMIKGAMQRVGVYYYIFPTYDQGRKIFWDGIDKDGLKIRDHLPAELVANTNESTMKLTLINGSIIQVVGTDRGLDNLMGTNPVGAIFSEYSLMNPVVRDFFRPIFRENGGRAIFVYTPRGKNHGRELYEATKNNKDWYVSVIKADEAFDVLGNRVITDGDIQSERDSGMDEDMIQQEFYCSFNASLKGAIYADQIKIAEQEKRVGVLPYEEGLPVYTFWDLGISDTTAIRFVQFYGKEIRIIDHYEMSGKPLNHYIDILHSKKYNYKEHYLPHDSEVRELTTGVTRIESMGKLGLKNIKVTPRLPVDQGIDATRRHFKNMWFDAEKCERGLNAIKSYVYSFDEKNRIRSRTPKHDRASNSADALRYMAVMYEDITKTTRPQKVITVDYSRFL